MSDNVNSNANDNVSSNANDTLTSKSKDNVNSKTNDNISSEAKVSENFNTEYSQIILKLIQNIGFDTEGLSEENSSKENNIDNHKSAIRFDESYDRIQRLWRLRKDIDFSQYEQDILNVILAKQKGHCMLATFLTCSCAAMMIIGFVMGFMILSGNHNNLHILIPIALEFLSVVLLILLMRLRRIQSHEMDRLLQIVEELFAFDAASSAERVETSMKILKEMKGRNR